MAGLQLIAISNIGKNLQKDYSSLTALMTSPPDINALVPYLKVTDNDSGRILYDNNRWLHIEDNSDVILDLLNMDIEVGKNGYPSLIAGTIKFKILNANKFITPENEIKIPGLFSLLSYKNVQFGWNDPRFSLFNEDVMEMKFDTTVDAQNTGIITMHVGSSLNYFNKIEHVFATTLKDTSTINSKNRESTSINYNGKELFSNETIKNIIDSELRQPYNQISYLRMFDNIMYDFDWNYPYKEYSTDGFLEVLQILDDIESLNGIEHLYTQWFSLDSGGLLVKKSPLDSADFYRFDGNHHYTQSWYGNFVDFSSFDVNNRKEIAIVPRISKYHGVAGNASSEIQSLRNDVYDVLDYSMTIYNRNLTKLEKNNGLDLFKNPINEDSYLAVPDAIEAIYYKEFLFNKDNSPFIKNYNFNPDGTPNLGTDDRTIEKERIEKLSKVHIQYILELRKLAGELYSNSNKDITSSQIKLKIREIYNKLSSTIIDDAEFINKILKPKEINVENYNYNILDAEYTFWKFLLGEKELEKPKFGIPESDITNLSSIKAIDLVTLLELNYRLRNKTNPFYYSPLWTTRLQSLDDFSKKIGDDKDIKKNNPNSFELQYFYTSNNLTSIHDCIVYLASQINKLLGRNVVENWIGSYYTIMIDTDADIDVKKSMEESKKEEIVNELNTDKIELFTWYESKNQLRLMDIVADLNIKLDKELTDGYKVKIKIYDGVPNLPDRSYEIKWNEKLYGTTSKNIPRKISIMGGFEEGDRINFTGQNRLEYLLIPKKVYDNIWADSGSFFEFWNKIFAHFRQHFNLNLYFSVYRINGITEVEIFCLDLITEAVNSWDGNTDFAEIVGKLQGRFIAFDYRANNSIITSFNASVQTQDSLFLSFMPAQTSKSIISLFEIGATKFDTLSKEALDNLEKIYNKIFKSIKTGNIPVDNNGKSKWNGMLNNIQAYNSNEQLGTLLKDGELRSDIEFLEAIVKFYNASGTYPAHLLFGGYSISLELVGINGFASFQLIGLRNSGLYDGIYMIEKAKHYIDKTTFKTTLDCKLLVPRIRKFKEGT